MADISKIKVGGTTYNIKDATARSACDITNETSTYSVASGITVNAFYVHKFRRMASVTFYFKNTSDRANNIVLLTHNKNFPIPYYSALSPVGDAVNGLVGTIVIPEESGKRNKIYTNGPLKKGDYCVSQFAYIWWV